MKRDKSIYENYVCPRCWNTLDNCTCELFPPYDLVHIDINIQEHIRILNAKGYHTRYCCEGHGVGTGTYIAFGRDWFEDVDMPNGFKYHKKNRTISYVYVRKKMTDEQIEALKQENLSALLAWIKELPDINIQRE